jgi:hypothetical protein
MTIRQAGSRRRVFPEGRGFVLLPVNFYIIFKKALFSV